MSRLITCMIVDDEPLAHQLLEKHIQKVPFLKLADSAFNAIDALYKISAVQPDVLFLDVNMPEMTGLELIKLLRNNKPSVILTTAYSNFAVEAFEYDVTDYLLKPISFERFMRSVTKVQETLLNRPAMPVAAIPEAEENSEQANAGSDTRHLMIKENKKFIKIRPEDILYIEGMKDYIKIYLAEKNILTHMTLTAISGMLNEMSFIRIHKSFIVNKAAIKSIEGNVIYVNNGKELPIGNIYKDQIRDILKSGRL
jgi:two-component system, LytTR family, response regulator